MDINEFLNLCVGNWFSQRSSYHFEQQQGFSDKSELIIEWLTSDHPEVIQLCQTYEIQANESLGGQKVRWDTSIDFGKTKQIGSSLVIFVPNPSESCQGKLLSDTHPLVGTYQLAADESLALTLEDDQQSVQERIWFASPNLRLRTSLIKTNQVFNRTAFYSEIRKLPPKES